MAFVIIEHGPDQGRQFDLDKEPAVLGRQADSRVCLKAKAVSRQHARILDEDGEYLLEDLGSSNGTFLNGQRMDANEPVVLTERDRIQIGPYVLALCIEPTPASSEGTMVVREQISAVGLHESVYGHAPAQKLQVVLEITQNLARTLDPNAVLDKLLDQLMRLFPHADRSMILLQEGDNFVVRGQRCRYAQEPSLYPYSRTVVKQAIDEGIGLISEDAQDDQRFDSSATIAALNLHSLMCVPLICPDERRLGVIQVDRFQRGNPFRSQDLQMLTAVSLQVAVMLDNAHLHSELVKEERLHKELELAREIQQGFLPEDLDRQKQHGYQLFGCVHPARHVSGDLYDYRELEDGRVSFFIGDVAGKGMPAALLTVAVHTLTRHLTFTGDSPAATLTRLSDSLAQDNTTGKFVTLEHGIFDPKTGEMTLASGGHPLPLRRRSDGTIDELPHRAGRPIGMAGLPLNIRDYRFTVEEGDTLIFFTDGLVEARHPETKELFGLERMKALMTGFHLDMPLADMVEIGRKAVQEHTSSTEMQDDLTFLILRRMQDAESRNVIKSKAGKTSSPPGDSTTREFQLPKERAAKS